MPRKKQLTRTQICRKIATGQTRGLRLRRLSEGCTREVFVTPLSPGVVYKVEEGDYEYGDESCNKLEVKYWRTSKPEVRKYLAAIVATSGAKCKVICQKRITVHKPWEYEWDNTLPGKLRRYSDLGSHNGGMDAKGQIKIWDYPII